MQMERITITTKAMRRRIRAAQRCCELIAVCGMADVFGSLVAMCLTGTQAHVTGVVVGVAVACLSGFSGEVLKQCAEL